MRHLWDEAGRDKWGKSARFVKTPQGAHNEIEEQLPGARDSGSTPWHQPLPPSSGVGLHHGVCMIPGTFWHRWLHMKPATTCVFTVGIRRQCHGEGT